MFCTSTSLGDRLESVVIIRRLPITPHLLLVSQYEGIDTNKNWLCGQQINYLTLQRTVRTHFITSPSSLQCSVGRTQAAPPAASVLNGAEANSHHYAAEVISKNIKNHIQLNVRHNQEMNSNHNIIVSVHQFDAWTRLWYKSDVFELTCHSVVL
jgi:hypothetical protein